MHNLKLTVDEILQLGTSGTSPANLATLVRTYLEDAVASDLAVMVQGEALLTAAPPDYSANPPGMLYVYYLAPNQDQSVPLEPITAPIGEAVSRLCEAVLRGGSLIKVNVPTNLP